MRQKLFVVACGGQGTARTTGSFLGDEGINTVARGVL
jgi:hypothetical protein